jgi:hypothetical protein
MKDHNINRREGMTGYAGIGLIVLSFILYGGILFLPFAPLSLELKGSAVMGLMIAGEGSFWIGAILAGKEAASSYRSFFRMGKRGEEKV